MLQYQAVQPATLELLKSIFLKPYIENFCLVGGTALALHLGHRISVDIDLFTLEDFSSEKLLADLSNDFTQVEIMVKTKNSLLVLLNDIRSDFIKFNYPFRDIMKVDNIRLLSLEDIAPMKLDAITGRGKKKDFFDIFFLLECFSLPEMLELHNQKYQHSTIFHVIKSLTWFEDAESDPDPKVLDKRITWKTVKSKISETVNKL